MQEQLGPWFEGVLLRQRVITDGNDNGAETTELPE